MIEITCINDTFSEWHKKFYPKTPTKGNKYTIRKITIQKGEFVLYLNEIRNDFKVNPEAGFHYSRFTDVPGNVLEWETVNELYKKQLL